MFELYDLTGKEKYRKAIDLVYSQIQKMPRTKEGNFWHKNIYPNQVWLDGLYMCQPFYMEYETRFHDKKNYDDIFSQFFNVVKNMRDPKTGLYYHAYDSSREMFWCDKVTGLATISGSAHQDGIPWLCSTRWTKRMHLSGNHMRK